MGRSRCMTIASAASSGNVSFETTISFHQVSPLARSQNRTMSLGVPASAATPVGRFRIVAFWEGISYLLLLFVAMPLKYGFGADMAVRIVGMGHGVLFLAYCLTLALAARRLGARLSLVAFMVSLVPAGTFWLERRLRRDEREPAR
jgi:integral membrane protein